MVLPPCRCDHNRARVEPNRAYSVEMTWYVLDPPTLLEVVARGVHISTDDHIVAPGTIRSEALALLFAAVQRGELAEEVALERHERLTELKMRLLNDRVSRRTAWKSLASMDGHRRATPSTSPSRGCRPTRSSLSTLSSPRGRQASCRWHR